MKLLWIAAASVFAMGFGSGYLAGTHEPARLIADATSCAVPNGPLVEAISEAPSDEMDEVQSMQASPVSPEETKFQSIYGRLGLRSDDTIHAVNGDRTSAHLLKLTGAFDRGNLCVQYERDDVQREVCFKRKQDSERVVDRKYEKGARRTSLPVVPPAAVAESTSAPVREPARERRSIR